MDVRNNRSELAIANRHQRFDWLTRTCNTCSQASVNMESDFTSIFLTRRKERFKTISLIKQPPKIIKTTFVASLT